MITTLENEWGGLVANGFKAIPMSFLEIYPALGISHGEFVFIVKMHSFVIGKQKIFPKVETVAKSMGKSKACIQKFTRELKRKGFLATEPLKRTQIYNFAPLYQAIRVYDCNSQSENTIVNPTPPKRVDDRQPLYNIDCIEPEKEKKTIYNLPKGNCPTPKGKGEAEELRVNGRAEKEKTKTTPISLVSQKATALDKDSINTQHQEQPPISLVKRYNQDSSLSLVKEEEKSPTGSSFRSTPPSPPLPRPTPLGKVIQTSLEGIKEKHKKFVVKSRKKNKNKSLAEYNCNDVGKLLQTEIRAKYGHFMGKLTMKERGQLKNMISEYGAEETAAAAYAMIKRWEELQAVINIRSFPSIAIFYGFRRTIMPWSVADNLPKVTPSYRVEFDPRDERPKGQEAGWGEDWQHISKDDSYKERPKGQEGGWGDAWEADYTPSEEKEDWGPAWEADGKSEQKLGWWDDEPPKKGSASDRMLRLLDSEAIH
jgi:hypothetical protein